MLVLTNTNGMIEFKLSDSLELSDKQITVLNNISSDVISIDLSNKGLRVWPSFFDVISFPLLTSLNLSGNSLTYIPSDIRSLFGNLVTLNLAGNNFSVYPSLWPVTLSNFYYSNPGLILPSCNLFLI